MALTGGCKTSFPKPRRSVMETGFIVWFVNFLHAMLLLGIRGALLLAAIPNVIDVTQTQHATHRT